MITFIKSHFHFLQKTIAIKKDELLSFRPCSQPAAAFSSSWSCHRFDLFSRPLSYPNHQPNSNPTMIGKYFLTSLKGRWDFGNRSWSRTLFLRGFRPSDFFLRFWILNFLEPIFEFWFFWSRFWNFDFFWNRFLKFWKLLKIEIQKIWTILKKIKILKKKSKS